MIINLHLEKNILKIRNYIKDIPFYVDENNKNKCDEIYDESVMEKNNWFCVLYQLK